MKLLFVLGNCHAYYRFIAPIVSEMKEANPGDEIILIAPDVYAFSHCQKHLFYDLCEPVKSVEWSTEKFRSFRSLLAYIYWVFLGVQSGQVLGRLSEKFFQRPLSESVAGKIIKESMVFDAARLLHRIGLNVFIARLVLAFFRFLELIKAPDRNIVAQIKEISPDLILVTPAIHPRSYDIDYLRAGLRLRIPTLAMIASWDHLSSKGLLSIVPDRVIVWNDVQVHEAQKYHAVARKQVVVTGAPVFDRMFEKRYLQAKSIFCKDAQLDPLRPYILWAASSQGACEDEKIIVKRFMQEMGKHPRLEGMQVLIRPHPNAAHLWKDWQMENAPVWSAPGFVNDEGAQFGLYNSIAHASAVLGLSTSLFLEAAILERPCALLKSSIVDMGVTYNKLIHFKYWLENGFPVAVENEVDGAHWLAGIVSGSDSSKDVREHFIESFLRPLGIDRPAAKVTSDAIFAIVASMREAT